MDEFKETLEKYGVDYEGVMQRFMNNRKMFIRLMDMFMKDENLQKLGKALEAGDYSTAFEAAHTLKGVTANMGLTPLHDAVCEIVEHLRAGRAVDYDAFYGKICREYEKTVELRELLGKAAPPSPR